MLILLTSRSEARRCLVGDTHSSGLIREKTRVGRGLYGPSGLVPLRLLPSPKVSDGNAVQITRKGDNFCAGVKDNAAHPFLACCAGQSL